MSSCCTCNAVGGGVISHQQVAPPVLNEDSITDIVENAGGNTNALLRFSLAWDSWSDLDLHAIEPINDNDGVFTGHSIYYINKTSPVTGGTLDVDMNVGSTIPSSRDERKRRPAVENIVYTDLTRMPNNLYKVAYVQFSVWDGRVTGNDEPYLLIEARKPDEERMSHYVLLKYLGGNQPGLSSTQHHLATVRKNNDDTFKIIYIPANVAVVKVKDFVIEGTYNVIQPDGSIAENNALTGEHTGG